MDTLLMSRARACAPGWCTVGTCWTGINARVLLALCFQVEGIAIDEESLAYLGEVGERTSLRHAVQVGKQQGLAGCYMAGFASKVAKPACST